MNWVDLGILAAIAVSGLFGWMRGLVREVLGIGAWVLAAWAALTWYPVVDPFVRKYVQNPDIAIPLAGGVVFVVALVALSVVASILGRLCRDSAAGSLDGTLGIVFGLVRGIVLIAAAYIAGGMLLPVERWPPVLQDARALPYIFEVADRLVSLAPEQFRPKVAAPPSRDTKAADLYQAAPAGSALDQRPTRN